MSTDPARFRRLMDLVGDALELPEPERAAFLAAQCGEDHLLRDEALHLLASGAPDSPTDDLRGPVVRAAAGRDAAPPTSIGPFEVIEVLGEGGMGIVYGALQHEPLRREVAIKVLRVASPTLLARFAAERQTLARLEHRGIATVHDAGTTAAGQPYLVMEWVRGEPLTRYCQLHQLAVEDRLRLFAQVCLAVHHAHLKGVIHRDLKPSNILVTREDDEAAAKVIDFGIARVMEDDPDVAAPRTAHGTMLGTLEYMSPEQAAGLRDGVDVRADVYSLGVILYELLTGTLPHASEVLRAASPVEVERLLRDTDPPTPSARLAAEAPVTHAASRRPAGVSRELDWVVMTALAKDPARRYQSAHALAADIDRLLRHEPVAAAPPGIGYRLAKLVRRHRTAAVASMAVLVAIVGGGIAATIGFVQADRARDRALVEARKAEAVSDFLTELIASAEPDRALGNVVTVRAVLDSAASRLDRDPPFPEYPDVEATIRLAIGNSYRELGEYRGAIAVLLPALEIWRRTLPPGDERLPIVLHRLGNSYWRLGEYEEALAYSEEVARIDLQARGRLSVEYANALDMLGNANADLGRYTVAESLYRTSIAIFDTVLAGKGQLPMAGVVNNLGTILVDLGHYDAAAVEFKRALDIRYRYLDPEAPNIGATLGNLGDAILRAGRVANAVDTLERAAAHLERVYGPDHLNTANAWRQLAAGYLAAKRFDDARRVLDRAHATYLARTGPTSHGMGRVLVRRGQVDFAAGRRSAGLDEMLTGWRYIEQGLGAAHPSSRWAADLIADRYAELGDDAAEAMWRARGNS